MIKQLDVLIWCQSAELWWINWFSLLGFSCRWKGENVATSEVADILTMARCILEANVYGVKVEGKTFMSGNTLCGSYRDG